LALNRKLPKAYNRVRESNFSLDGLVGFDLHGKTIGVVGTGKIGRVFAKILLGMGCKVLAYDRSPDTNLIQAGVKYESLENIFQEAKIVSLHLPLTPETKHIINYKILEKAPSGLILVNTSRGALIDTKALIQTLKSGHLGGAALDVYEEEEGIFFSNLSDQILLDDQLARLLTFPNVILTAHQAFLTEDALQNIAHTTLQNISDYEKSLPLCNAVHAQTHHR
jgi:D-lactate dehydrogenase